MNNLHEGTLRITFSPLLRTFWTRWRVFACLSAPFWLNSGGKHADLPAIWSVWVPAQARFSTDFRLVLTCFSTDFGLWLAPDHQFCVLAPLAPCAGAMSSVPSPAARSINRSMDLWPPSFPLTFAFAVLSLGRFLLICWPLFLSYDDRMLRWKYAFSLRPACQRDGPVQFSSFSPHILRFSHRFLAFLTVSSCCFTFPSYLTSVSELIRRIM